MSGLATRTWLPASLLLGIAGLATLFLGWWQEAQAQRTLNEASLKQAGYMREVDQIRLALARSPDRLPVAKARLTALAALFEGETADQIQQSASCLQTPACADADRVDAALDRAQQAIVLHLSQTREQTGRRLIGARSIGGLGALLCLGGLLLFALVVVPRAHPAMAEDAPEATALPAEAEPTSQRALEELLRARLEELYSTRLRVWESERFSAYGELAAGLHHGLKTPLASVRAAAQVAQSKLGPDHPAMANLDDIINEVDGLVEQIKRFLQAAGHGEPVPARLDVESILAALDDSYAEAARQRGVTWETESEDGLGAVSVDPALLEVALRNIIENALAVAPRESRVRVSASTTAPPDRAGLDNAPPEPGDWIQICVEDEGPGVPREVVVGTRVESSKPNGSGLGLAIARRIVARHGGTLLFDTQAEQGTHVRILLPVAEP